MNKPELSSHNSAIGVMLLLEVLFGAAALVVFFKDCPQQLREVVLTTFCGWNGALGYALTNRNSSDNHFPSVAGGK